jgi:glucosamine--fructose-6-phosphate aminotransferase (isomerizing)
MNESEGRVAATLTWQEARTGATAVATALEAARRAPDAAIAILHHGEEVVITGAGSSLYLAQAIAWTFREATGRPAIAVPLSELLLRREGILGAGPGEHRPIVVISRSGSTTEAVAVAERAAAERSPMLAITCRGDSPLARATTLALVSTDGDEAAVVMTRSFTSMLALGLRLVARASGYERLAADLDILPARWPETAPVIETALELATRPWSRIVILGGGAARAVSSEAALKLTETSQIPTDAFEPLEFRHGPISVCEPGVLVIALPDMAAAHEELRVVAETLALGASAWVIGPVTPDVGLPPVSGAGETPGELIVSSLGAGLHHAARLPLLLPPIQAFAIGLALTRGCDPDRPRHLSQVVVLED